MKKEEIFAKITERLEELVMLRESGTGNIYSVNSMILVNENILYLITNGYDVNLYKIPEVEPVINLDRVFFTKAID